MVSDVRRLALDRQFDGILAWDIYFFLGHDDQRWSFDVFAAHAAPPESDLGAGRKKRYREHPLVELISDFDHQSRIVISAAGS